MTTYLVITIYTTHGSQEVQASTADEAVEMVKAKLGLKPYQIFAVAVPSSEGRLAQIQVLR